MLIFCSLALLVKIKLCGGNLCDSFFFSSFLVLLPSLQRCGNSCPTDLTAELLPNLTVLQDETHAREWANCCLFFFFNLHLLLALQASLLLLLPGAFNVDCLVQSVAFLSGHIGPVKQFAATA